MELVRLGGENGLRGIETGRNRVFQGSDEAFEGCRGSRYPPFIRQPQQVDRAVKLF